MAGLDEVITVSTGAELTVTPTGGIPPAREPSVLERLSRSPLDADTLQWVVAALDSENALVARSRGEAVPSPADEARVEPSTATPQCFLGRVEVRGFRGIGRSAVLDLTPGPGLTVIVGRNGSGKSSFAEAIEAALTGRNRRWDAMPAAWRDGWRNLHIDEPTEVAVDIHTAGGASPLRIARWWTGDSVRSARAEVRHGGGETAPVSSLGWVGVLGRYRPFLSYDELGRAVTGRAAELYDTLTELLGLTDLAEAERRLAKFCDRLSKQESRPRRERDYLLERLNACTDPRARRAAGMLRSESVSLDRLASLAADDGPADPNQQRVLRRLRRLSVPERALMSDVISELRGASMELEMTADTKAAQARGLADLLQSAIDHAERHTDVPECPVCDSGIPLDREWMSRARAEISRLEPTAEAASSAHERADNARDQARFLIAPRPSWLPEHTELGQLWDQWSAGSQLTDLAELARHIDDLGPRLRSAAIAARKSATSELENPESGWREVSEQLAAWVEDARAAIESRELLQPATRALEWLTNAAREIRDERLRPLSAHAEHVWQNLRQERHIDMEALRLVGRGAGRRVAVDVRVDAVSSGGEDGNAPGLLSQGELQALALSICLPRTLLSGNPFGFLVLDDPVQAMDTETVEGLAGVLAEVGQYRQVVVFTHDTRLPDALTRAALPATVRGIHRDSVSNVQVDSAP